MTGRLFSLRGVLASRGGRPVFRDLDLDIAEGMTAVRGPSGSGKSTLLRLLNRLADPDAGTVAYAGDDVRGLDPLDLRRRVCLVPQLPALVEGDVARNVRLGPRLCGRDADVTRCLELAGLDMSYAAREAGRLSVGEQQRVMLARALALDPEVLLLDEPTSALDEESRAGVECTLSELGRELDTSAVVVTHDRGQAERLAGSNVLELNAGAVV
ncbi:MAG: ATP-binding cassette domain-containing protein [Thermoleophilaceae bacterium]|nr:ATP-binding cassette domain-containing protein [Thermoleophilaceae bacterium]